MSRWFFLEKLIFFEFVILFFFISLILFVSFFYEISSKIKQRKKKVIQEILTHFLAEQIYVTDIVIPEYLRDFEIFISVIEEFDIKMTSLSWTLMKEWVIHDIFKEKLRKTLSSSFWAKNLLALRALNLSPRVSFLEKVKPFLEKTRPILRFSAVPILIQMGTKEAIYSVIKAMAKESKTTQYPYRDNLLKAPVFIYKILQELYHSCQEREMRLCCLKVLSTKVGFLQYTSLEKDLHGEDLEVKWWAIRALANNPSMEIFSFLKKQVEDKDWRIRSLSWQILGRNKLHEDLGFFTKGLEDEHYWVRICAGWAIKGQGEEGIKILQNQTQEKQTSFSVSQYVLQASYAEFEKNLETMSVYL